MDILIKGMEMKDYPQSITINPDGSVVKDTFGLHRPMDEWKAVALPEHHGRLIDADQLQDILRLVLSLFISNELTEKEISLVHRTIGAISEAINDLDTVVEATE